MTSRAIIAMGIVLLAISLLARYDPGILWLVAPITSWLGCILVAVGSGRMLFLEK